MRSLKLKCNGKHTANERSKESFRQQNEKKAVNDEIEWKKTYNHNSLKRNEMRMTENSTALHSIHRLLYIYKIQ